MKKRPLDLVGDRFPSLLNPGMLIIHASGVFPGSKAIASALQSNPPSLAQAIFILASLAGSLPQRLYAPLGSKTHCNSAFRTIVSSVLMLLAAKTGGHADAPLE